MSVTGITTNGINYIKGTELEGMSVQMMAAMVMLEVGATKKHEAEMKIGEMKAQNDRAKKLNDLVDKIMQRAGACVGDGDDAKKGRFGYLATCAQEAQALGINTGEWGLTGKDGLTQEQLRAITSQIQHMAENCNSDNQTQMVKLQDFMGQYNSFISGASDQVKNANQILQGLAKN